MEITFLQENLVLIGQGFIVLLFLILCVLFWIRSRRLRQLLEHYQMLLSSYDQGNLEHILEQVLERAEQNQKNIDWLKEQLNQVEQKLAKAITRVGMVRYKAFEDMGGDLSFSLAALDENGTGFLLTCIHGREESRTYAKFVRQGESDHFLSPEEIEAINAARDKS